MKQHSSKPLIAVIGVGALFPGDPEPDGFWRDIVAGRDSLSDVPPTHWLIDDYYDPDPKSPGKTYARRGGFIQPVPFDPIESGIPPIALSSTDTAQLLALVVARRVLSDACGLRFDRIDRKRTSVILGVASATELVNTMSGSLQRPVWAKALREEGLQEEQVTAICDRMAAHYVDWTENTFPGLLGNVTAGRVANRFDLGGTNCVIDAACASSLGALQMAMQELWNGDADMALTGGVDALNDIFMYMCFSKTPAMSPTGDCRPFSAEADGTMLGEGVGMFALRRLEDAERDGDHVYAVLRGIGSSSDGRATSIYAPRPEGQELALRRAYEAAGYGPQTVELVEAHGTGTIAGDAAEFQALKRVFADGGRTEKGWCSLGSVKSQIGHTKGAAGAASLYKAVMALHHKVLPPTIKIRAPNPALGIADSPFSLNTTARPWVGNGRHTRRASVSSFGFGGSNFHLSLEEYRGPAPRPARIRTVASELFLLSGATRDELFARTVELAKRVTLNGFAFAARESQTVFDGSAEHRLAIVAEAASLAARLDVARKNLSSPLPDWNVQGVAYGTGRQAEGKIAFLFPGQGSQYVDMAAEITMAFERATRIWDDANAAFIQAEGQSLARDVFPAAALTVEERSAQAARLTATDRAQPAIGVTSLLLLDLLRGAGVEPDCCAGHSFGELTALLCAGVFGSDDFLTAARMRGKLMADAARSTPGAMLAVSASANRVQDLLTSHGKGVVIANINSPQQVVVAGGVEEIEAFSTHLSKLKVSSRRLPVATAFHSPIVAGAVAPFAERLATLAFASPRVPVIAGSTAAPYPQQPEAIRELLSRQLAEPVRFADQIAALHDRGARIFVEVGPRGVLTDLVGRCLAGKDHVAIATNTGTSAGLAELWMTFGRLAALGLPLDLSFAWEGYSTAAQPSAEFSPVTVKITGANYGKVYPLTEGASKAPPPPATPVSTSAWASPATPTQRQEPGTGATLRMPARGADAIGTPTDTTSAPTGYALGVSEAGWLSALQQMLNQAATAHAAAQRAMADTHLAYLAATEAGFAQFREIATGRVASPSRESVLSAAPSNVPAPSLREVDLPSSTAPTPWVMPPATMSFAPPFIAANPSPGVETVPLPTPAAANLSDLVFGIVAEKTGYPRDILTPKMDLEAELGIDSIKRVEILSAVMEARPDLPAFDAQALGSLRTLGAILQHLDAASDAAAPAAVANVPPPPATIAPSGPRDLIDIVLDVVSEKTGYPRETLGLDMDLEADLGIDSIKRVEILAAVTAARPDLPTVDAQMLGALRTLAAILAHLGGNSGAGADSAAAPMVAAAPQPVSYKITRRGIREVLAQPEAQSLDSGLGHVRKVAVVDEGSDLGRMLVARLQTQGVQSEVTRHVPPDADGVVVIEGSGRPGEDKVLSAARQIFTAAQGFAATAAERGGIFVTVQDSGGDFGLSGCCNGNAWMAGAPGLIKTLAQEWPRADVKAIDLERNGHAVADLADRLAAELMSGGHREVGLRADGRRTTLEDFDLPVRGAFEPSVLGENPVIVVSAGARGVTASCILALARVMRMRLLLIGRTPLETEPDGFSAHADGASLKAALHAAARARGETLTPRELGQQSARIIAGREIGDALRRLEQLGSEALYVCADIVDASAVAEAVGAARSRWGRIDGIIHGAGTLADKRVAEKSVEQFERVFSTKVLGLRALLAATEHDQLRLICLFSSVAARFGNAGQADYALANETMNKVARAEAVRRGPSCHVRSLNWGPWDGGMVSPELREHFVRRGIPVIKVEDGAAAFVEEICRRDDDLSHVDVVLSSSLAV